MGCRSSQPPPVANAPQSTESTGNSQADLVERLRGDESKQDEAVDVKVSPVLTIPQRIAKQPGSENGSAIIDLYVRCEDLLPQRKRPFSSFAVAYSKLWHDEAWTELGKTEVVADMMWPNYGQCFKIPFCAEVVRLLRFEIYRLRREEDASDPDYLMRQSFIGGAEVRLVDTIAAKTVGEGTIEGWLIRDLMNPTKAGPIGRLALWADEDSGAKNRVCFQMAAKKLSSTDFWKFTVDPFFLVHRTKPVEDEVKAGANKRRGMVTQTGIDENMGPKLEQMILRSEVIRRQRSPTWKIVKDMSAGDMCAGDATRPIVIEIWDWFRSGKPRLIGSAETNYEDIHKAFFKNGEMTLEMFHVKTKKIEGVVVPVMERRGDMIMQSITIDRTYTFLDYIRGGLSITPIVAVDMTIGNLEPQHRHSLHHLNGDALNGYAESIKAILEVLEGYPGSTPKAVLGYPVYGFGAKLPPAKGKTSHCFSLTGDFLMPLAVGAQGALDAYKNSLRVVTLSGPTQLKEVIQLAVQWARDYVQVQDNDINDFYNHKYFVFLIVTCGNVNEQQATVDAISEAVGLPLSLIIVGVGDENLEFLECLNDEVKASQQLNLKVACRMGHTCELVIQSPTHTSSGGGRCDECLCKVSTCPTRFDCQLCGVSLCESCSMWIAQRISDGPVYRDMITYLKSNDYQGRPGEFAAAALARLPEHVVDYYKTRDIKPRKLSEFENSQGMTKERPKIYSKSSYTKGGKTTKELAEEEREKAKERAEEAKMTPKQRAEKLLEKLRGQVPDFIREKEIKMLKAGQKLGYSALLVDRALKDGIAEESLEALVENIVHGSVDRPCYKDAVERLSPKPKQVRPKQGSRSRLAMLSVVDDDDDAASASSLTPRSQSSSKAASTLDRTVRSTKSSKEPSMLGQSLRSVATSKDLPRSVTSKSLRSAASSKELSMASTPRSGRSSFALPGQFESSLVKGRRSVSDVTLEDM